MPNWKGPLSKEEIAAVGLEVERRVMDPLKRRLAWEGKKVESQIKGLSVALGNYLEAVKHEIAHAIRENEQTLELVARELARRGKKNDELDAGNAPP